VSIDHHIYVSAGLRNGIDRTVRHPEPGFRTTPHQVFLAQAAPFLIDEQYYFEDPLDARWFWDEGWKDWAYRHDDGNGGAFYGCDRMSLWIGDGAPARGPGIVVKEPTANRGPTVFEEPLSKEAIKRIEKEIAADPDIEKAP